MRYNNKNILLKYIELNPLHQESSNDVSLGTGLFIECDIMALIYQSSVSPFDGLDRLTIPQWISQYNPDAVPANRVVHSDDFGNDLITYGSLRRDAGRIAWGLRTKLGLQEGDIVLALIPNSVAILDQTTSEKITANL